MNLLHSRTRTPPADASAKTLHPDETAPLAAATTPETAPPTPARRTFGFSEIANMFVRLRRHQRRATVSSQRFLPAPSGDGEVAASSSAAATSTSALTSGQEESSASAGTQLGRVPSISSPTRIHVRKFNSSPYGKSSAQAKGKPHHVVSSSGEDAISHPGVKESAVPGIQAMPVEYTDRFECVGGVNVTTLLRATRTTLLETVVKLGANALIDEQWDCIISGPKNGVYKVQTRYAASATRCMRPDPRRPVALDQAKGIPGLMTILKREDA